MKKVQKFWNMFLSSLHKEICKNTCFGPIFLGKEGKNRIKLVLILEFIKGNYISFWKQDNAFINYRKISISEFFLLWKKTKLIWWLFLFCKFASNLVKKVFKFHGKLLFCVIANRFFANVIGWTSPLLTWHISYIIVDYFPLCCFLCFKLISWDWLFNDVLELAISMNFKIGEQNLPLF